MSAVIMNFYNARPLLNSEEGESLWVKVLSIVLMLCSLAACGAAGQQDTETPDISEE